MIWAILRAQLLSMRLRKRSRRNSMLFSALTSLLFYGFWGFFAWGGVLFFSQADQQPYFLPVLSAALLFVMIYWQLAPVISASFGASLDLRKLLAYPIPHRKLFTVEILLRLTTCAEMLIVMAGAAIGLLRNPLYGPKFLPGILAGLLLFTGANILLSAGARSLLERIFLRTKLREVMMLLLVFAGFAPQILAYMHVKGADLIRFSPSQIAWPWAAAARLMLGASAYAAVAVGAVWVAIAWSFSRWQFERSIRYDASELHHTVREARADGLVDRFFQFPSRILPDPLAALAEKELRTFARIPRFRLVYTMSCFFSWVMFLPMMRQPEKHQFGLQFALPFFSLYGLLMLGQISYWNCLGFDRSAAQGYFSWPIAFRDVLIAKNLVVFGLLIPQILILAVIARLFHLPSGFFKILESFAVMVIASLYWFAMGNIYSVRIPRALDPGKMNQMANKMQALTIWTAPLLLLPLVLAYWSRWFFENNIVFAALLLFAALIGGIFYWVGLDSAVNTANARRESILLELSRSDGPLSVT